MRQKLSQYLFRYGVAVLAWLACIAAHAEQPITGPKLHWVKNDAPPFYIIESDSQQGFGDQLQTLIEDALDAYQHDTLHVPLSRLSSSWAAYDPLCFATMIHEAPLSDDYLLSVPNAMYLPHGIITTSAFAESLPRQSNGSVSLESVISASSISMGHISGRTYGEKLDDILRRYRHNIEINTRAGSTETKGILTMLSQGRFDFVIDYEFVLNHYAGSDEDADQLRFLPIAETHGSFILGAVGCTNSSEGKKAIQAINKALPDIVKSRSYRRAVAAWLVPVGDEAYYWNKFDDVLKKYLGLPVRPHTTARLPLAGSE
tara:strand:+ start:1440 stop:2387 length:948 start_codon:yes stop_codon:yes gene_type:complete